MEASRGRGGFCGGLVTVPRMDNVLWRCCFVRCAVVMAGRSDGLVCGQGGQVRLAGVGGNNQLIAPDL